MKQNKFTIGAIVGLIVIAILAFGISQAIMFHLTSSTPQNNSTTNQYSDVVFNFNKPMATSKPGINEITLDPSTAGQATVSGNSITFTPSIEYAIGKNYHATLKGVTDTQGKKLSDITINFTTQLVQFSDLPAYIQKRLTVDPSADQGPYVPGIIAIGNSATLIDHGLSDDQLYSFKTQLFNFFQLSQQTVRALDISNIVKAPHVRGSFNDTVTFYIAIKGVTTYRGQLDYSDTSTVRLILTDPKTSQQLYDSQTAQPLGQ
jgi:multisubunit Na+/H+ antiporter MnhE subunit